MKVPFLVCLPDFTPPFFNHSYIMSKRKGTYAAVNPNKRRRIDDLGDGQQRKIDLQPLPPQPDPEPHRLRSNSDVSNKNY